jgi:hypothetical protein
VTAAPCATLAAENIKLDTANNSTATYEKIFFVMAIRPD